jgi:tetratricopeptide (TPR) repeat protein
VAWIAERKDVLSTFFGLLTLGAYAWYVRKPGWQRYLLVMVFLSLGLMAKPMLVTLPFVLLLLDYWPLRRMPALLPAAYARTPVDGGDWVPNRSWPDTLWRLLLEKLPLFLLVVASSFATVWAQQKAGAVASIGSIPLAARFANAVAGYAAYLKKMVWPDDLSVYYPYQVSVPVWQIAGSLLLLVAITALAVIAFRRAPYIAVGWAFYLGTLVPVIGLVQVGNQAMADRYTYLPLLGIFIVIAWGGAQLLSAWPHGRAAAVSGGIVILFACLWATSRQLEYWKDSVSLFTHSLAVAPGAAPLHNNLANVLLARGEIPEAEEHAREAVRLSPGFGEAHNNLGRILNSQGRFQEGIPHLEQAIRLQPDSLPQLVNLALIRSAHPDASLRDGKQAVSLASHAEKLTQRRDPAVLDLLGMALAEGNRFDEAISAAQAARDLAVSTGREQLARSIESRLELYRMRRPYRVPFG